MAEPKQEVEAPPAPYNLGLGARDIQPNRLRVVGKLSKLVELDIAKPGDIAVGQDAEDPDSVVLYNAKTGKEPVRFYVLAIHANYACGFNGPPGTWEEGDPEMPAEAKRQYNYTMFVPDYDELLPVVYTAGGTAAREARKLQTALARHCISGAPYELAFQMTTKINTSGQNSWPGPVFAATEAVADEVEKARAMHDSIVGPPRPQLAAGEDGEVQDQPGF